jgi:hypothetical protein
VFFNEEILSKDLAKDIAEEIDIKILTSIFRDIGWHEVWIDAKRIDHLEMKEWLGSHPLKGNYWNHQRFIVWMFELESDLVFFKLKWT